MYPVECDKNKIIPDYLFYLLLSERFTKYAVSVSARTGMPKINRQDLDLAIFYVPSINEQVKISDFLHKNWLEIESLEKYLNCFKIQKQGLMQQLLTGKKRVKL